MIDQEIKTSSEAWADKFIKVIDTATSNKKIEDKEFARLHEQLHGFGVLESSQEEIRRHAALYKYRKRMFAKEHPPKKKASKWDIISGKV